MLAVTIIGLVVAIPLFIILPIFHVVCMIVAAFKANEGMRYRYPLTIRLIK